MKKNMKKILFTFILMFISLNGVKAMDCLCNVAKEDGTKVRVLVASFDNCSSCGSNCLRTSERRIVEKYCIGGISGVTTAGYAPIPSIKLNKNGKLETSTGVTETPTVTDTYDAWNKKQQEDYEKYLATAEDPIGDIGSITDPVDCSDVADLVDEILKIYNLLKIALAVLLVILSLLDFVKATASPEDDGLSKAFKKLTTRAIIMAIIFLLPVLIQWILNIVKIDGLDDSCLTNL